MTNTTEEIVADLKERLERHPVWVWYDSHEKYSNIIDDIEAAMEDRDVNVAQYDESFLDLKRTLWEQDNEVEEKWLFYVPLWRDDADWFMDIHRLGREYRPGVRVGESPAAKYLVGKEDRIPDDYANWNEDEQHLDRAFFCVLFDSQTYSPREFIVEYLADPDSYRESIEEFDQGPAWDSMLDETYGIDAGLDPDELATQILFGEVQHHAPVDRYAPLAAANTKEADRLCRFWQNHDTETYLEYARQVAEGREIADAIVDSELLDWYSEAFREIDDGLVRLLLARLVDSPFDDLPELAEDLGAVVDRRRTAFWFTEGYAKYWNILYHGLHAIDHSSAAITTLDEERFTPAALGEQYTSTWWETDAEYRRYIRSCIDYRGFVEGIDEFRTRVTNYYTRFLQAVNRPLAESIVDDPSLGESQTTFFETHALREPETAIIICDGLRYELAREVASDFEEDDIELDLGFQSAALPSVTEVGMAAHLPGQLELAVDEDQLAVSVDGQRMDTKQDRVVRFEAAGFSIRDIDDVLAAGRDDLEGDENPPLVVYSRIIDSLGENLDDDRAFSTVGDHVRDVEDVIRRLRTVGYTRFVVTADHGFLYTERLPDELKVESIDDVAGTKRRFAFSDTDAPVIPGDEVVEFGAEELDRLGIEAPDVRVFFPRSVACFKAAGGNMQYFHGGISMQELTVPRLTIATEKHVDSEGPMEIAVAFPDAVTNLTVDVGITVRSGKLSFDRTPTIRLTASIGDRPVADPTFVDLEQGENEAILQLKPGAIEDDDETITFEAIDEESRELIERHESQMDIVVRDDVGFDV